MKPFIRLITYDPNDTITDISEFEGDINTSQLFRPFTGTCTRLFSRKLREAIESGEYVRIEKGEYK